MSKKKDRQEPDELKKVESAISRSEAFIENYIKELGIVVLIIAVLISGFVLFRYKYLAPREIKAQEQSFKGEFYFSKDSFQLALNGNGVDFIGFKSIVKEYSMTKTANLAKAYTGISYYKLKDYKNAIKYLNDFDANDELISPAIVGLVGDCYVELGDVNKAITYFEKAAKADNNVISPIFLKKIGIAYESQGKYDKAIESYTTIKDKYFKSSEAYDIDKYIERAKFLKK